MTDTSPSRRRIRPFVAALAVAVLQTAVLGYMIESRASILRNGKDVLLKIAPVDPRDLLRGDYIILSYEISRIPADLVVGGFPQEGTDAVLFVRLREQADGFWAPAEASFNPLTPTADSVVIRSLPFSYYPLPGMPMEALRPDYGIERYYVPEGEGRALEAARSNQGFAINVRIDSAGRGQIRRVLMNGTPIYEEPLY
ncbi:GDYXXLXY domain-containing protein [Sinorhizobium numidicum]|uniref:GDYXXLXY domain-containing protein n=1 Tax=Sinorhizobium numidicum TaxID=680248 RepID=A0ABY8CUD6_9HYPH|nr:GDYXXLXY domain-containing protein [Sinorhizobium numidicum]WEX78864.1 GDYXXLXY domain-containing protein [Sinorhizobium numidicum]WEX82261.1 GDYXXLXY domain-containing protein [Sinorhizobium numidicum]